MSENNRTVFILLLFLSTVQFIQARTCYSNNSLPLNYNHDFRSGSDCLPCFYTCTQCPNPTTRDCGASLCVQGYFYSNSFCQECPANCRSCNASNCLNCWTGFYLSSGICISCSEGAATCSISSALTCRSSYYYDTITLNCVKCLNNCTSCRNSQSCDFCSNSFYYNSAQLSCSPCPSMCQTCTQANICDVCQPGTFRNSNGTCVNYTNCPSKCLQCPNGICTLCMKGFYAKGSVCIQGTSSLCKLSIGPDFGSCISCESQAMMPADAATYCIPRQTNSLVGYYLLTAFNNPNIFGNSYKVCDHLVSPSGKSFSFNLTVKASYQITVDTQLFFYSTDGTFDFNLTISTLTSNKSFPYSESSLSSTQTCNNLPKVVIEQRTTIGLDSDNFTFTINSNNNFSVSQIFIKFDRCQVSRCQICNSSTLCASCFAPYLLMKNTCVMNCDAGYYINTINRTCVYSCPLGMFTDLANYQCLACQSPCLACSSLVDCLSCRGINGTLTYLEGKRCLAKCSSNLTYEDNTTLTCVRCLSPCQTCSITGRNCTSCLSGYLNPVTGTCVAQCPPGTYSDFTLPVITCSKCVGCQTCALNKSICLSCTAPLVLTNSTCLASCPNGSFAHSGICLSCDLPCKTCINSSRNCSSCNFGSLIFENNTSFGRCLATCPFGYYSDNNSNCIVCPVGCATCRNSSYCDSCLNVTMNGSTVIYYLQNFVCAISCSSGYKDTATNLCASCKYPCITCQIDFTGTLCNSCEGSLYLLGTKCVFECIEGYYQQNQSCLSCRSECKTCSSNSTCDSCKPTINFTNASSNELFVFESFLSKCVSKTGCLNDFFVFFNISTKLYSCQPCTSSCQTCFLSSSNCTSCVAPLLYFKLDTGGSCLSICPNGYYSSGGGCLHCSSNCRTCVNQSDNCTSCSLSLFLLANKCVLTCPNGTYASQASSKCQNCSVNCARCFGKHSCSECQYVAGINYYLYNSLCITNCPAGTVVVAKECKQCSNNCSTCSQGISNCTSCLSGLFLFANGSLSNCVSSCPSQFYGDTITMSCKPCKLPCLLCSGLTICDSCSPDSLIKTYLIKQSCQTSCPDGTFPNTTTLICQNCSYPCRTCNSTTCLSCLSGLFWYKSNCSQTCPIGYYGDVSNGLCSICIAPCIECTSAYICQNCSNNFFVKNGVCVRQCPLGTYSEKSTGLCLPCDENCLQCENSSIACTKCSTQFNLYAQNSTCLSQCPAHYFSSTSNSWNTCVICSEMCGNCTQNLTKCTSCNTGLLQDFQCVSSCSPQYYQASGQCMKCSNNCYSCDNSTKCNQCVSSFLLYGSCMDNCPSKYYRDFARLECRGCPDSCSECLNEYLCTSCVNGFALLQDYCISKPCPEPYYINSSDSCVFRCTDQQYVFEPERICYDKCPDNFYVTGRNCVESCQQNEYINVNQECKKCGNTNKCENPLTFSATPLLKQNHIIILILFNQPFKTSNPNLKFKIEQQVSRRLLATSLVLTPTAISPRTVELRFSPQSSISQSTFNLSVEGRVSDFIDSNGGVLQQRTTQFTIKQFTMYQDTVAGFMATILTIIIYLLYTFNAVWIHRTQLMWSAIEFGQILFFLCLLPIQLPPSIQQFLFNFQALHVRFLKMIYPNAEILNYSPAKFYQYTTDVNYLRNVDCDILLFILVGIVIGVAIAVRKYARKDSAQPRPIPNWLESTVQKIFTNKYLILTEVTLITLMNASLFGFAQYNDPNTNSNPYLGFNLTVSILSSICTLLLPLLLTISLHYQLSLKPRQSHKFFLGMNLQKHPTGLLINCYKIIRRISFAILLGLFQQSAAYVLAVTLLLTVTIVLILHMYRPYVDELRNRLCVGEELCLVVVLGMFIILMLNDGASASSKMIIGGFMQLFGIGLVVTSLVYPMLETYKYCRRYFKKPPNLEQNNKAAINQPINQHPQSIIPNDQQNSSLKLKPIDDHPHPPHPSHRAQKPKLKSLIKTFDSGSQPSDEPI